MKITEDEYARYNAKWEAGYRLFCDAEDDSPQFGEEDAHNLLSMFYSSSPSYTGECVESTLLMLRNNLHHMPHVVVWKFLSSDDEYFMTPLQIVIKHRLPSIFIYELLDAGSRPDQCYDYSGLHDYCRWNALTLYLDYYDEVDNSEAVKVIERLLNHKHAAVFQTAEHFERVVRMAYEAYKKEQSSLIFDLMELRLSSNLLELPAGMDLKVERIFDTITKGTRPKRAIKDKSPTPEEVPPPMKRAKTEHTPPASLTMADVEQEVASLTLEQLKVTDMRKLKQYCTTLSHGGKRCQCSFSRVAQIMERRWRELVSRG